MHRNTHTQPFKYNNMLSLTENITFDNALIIMSIYHPQSNRENTDNNCRVHNTKVLITNFTRYGKHTVNH